MSKFPFVKYHGAGNDFVLMDFYHHIPSMDFSALARSVCDRRYGVGADGLLLLFPSTVADFQMRIFNADGSEAAMCGNGLRCLASYVLKSRNIPSSIAIETQYGVLKCRKAENQIAVNMGHPTKLHWPIDLERYSAYVIDTGVPHAVVFVDQLDEVDIAKEGRWLRFHPCFAPSGVNVNFVRVMQDGKIALRTYERGIEAETLACGTGAAAAAFVAKEVKHATSPLCVLTRLSFDSSQIYPARPKTWNLDSVKAPGLNDRKRVHISNIDPFAIVQPRELSHGPNPKFLAGRGISYQQTLRFLFPKRSEDSCEIEMVGGAEEVFTGLFKSLEHFRR